MFRNYAITALRNMVRNRLYTAINIFGLTVAFAAALLIALFVRDEFSYDKWIPNAANIYMLATRFPDARPEPLYFTSVPVEIAQAMKTEFSGIDKVVGLNSNAYGVRHGDVETLYQVVYFASPDLFSVIQLPAVGGDLKTALEEPDSAVLSLSTARMYFGVDAPIGELLELNRSHPVKVAAVIKDLPSNSQFNFQVILSSRSSLYVTQAEKYPHCRQCFYPSTTTYFTLKPGASIAQVDRGLPAFFSGHKDSGRTFFGSISPATLYTLPFTGFHLQGRGTEVGQLNPPTDRKVATTTAIVGTLILLIAAVNFVTLSTARASRRAAEVGMRKVLGAASVDLVIQFVGESLMYVAFSAILGVALVSVSMPAFNAYLSRTFVPLPWATGNPDPKRMIVFDFWAHPLLLGAILMAILVMGVAAGAYPAFVLSRFRPKNVLRSGAVQPGGSGRLRSALVILQFAILFGLTLSSVVIFRQMDYALNRAAHMDTTRVQVVGGACEAAFVNAVRAIAGVERVVCGGNQLVDRGLSATDTITAPDGTALAAGLFSVDIGFFEFYGLKPLVGRLFSLEFPGDRLHRNPPPPRSTVSIVVNRTLAREVSPNNPAAAVGMALGLKNWPEKTTAQVIGVVPDFALDSIHNSISPAYYYLNSEDTVAGEGVNIRLRAAADETVTLGQLDKAFKEHFDGIPEHRYSLERHLKDTVADIIRRSEIFTALTALAVFVASLGLFGLSLFSAETRTKEIGIRKAMGATRGEIVGLLLRHAARPVLLANVIAWPAAYVIMRGWLEGFADHVDLALWMFVGTTVVMLVIALLTVIGQALRVARMQPVAALRYE